MHLPEFPWDALKTFATIAHAHPDGIVDLSVGSPVDSTPELVRTALTQAGDAHAYPVTEGKIALREAICAWYERRRSVFGLTSGNVFPTIGSKEFVALLPTLLGLGANDLVVQPGLAYPSYAVGAAVVGAKVLSEDDPDLWPENTRLIWLNSPGNPDGRVHLVEFLRRAVERARDLGAIIVNDECYAELMWDSESAAPSILDPQVCGGSWQNILAIYSLSKQSNLAGYRAGFVAGGNELVAKLVGVRKHLGLIPPAPVQAAMLVALGDSEHVAVQKERYRARRETLRYGLENAGFQIELSEAGLYLWATRNEECWQSVAALAELGILVAPGSFYGQAGNKHVRCALTASDERIAAAAARLSR